MSPRRSVAPTPAVSSQCPPSILVVEDEWITAQDIRQTLTEAGYLVPAVAASGAAAIDAVANGRPDLALVDVRLEGAMDGIELAAELKRRFHVPVVYLTAHSDRDTVERLKQTAPLGYIGKPFDGGQLRVAVDLALQNAALERALLDEQATDKARLHELESKTAVLEGRLREIAGLVSDQSVDEPATLSADVEGRLRGLSRREVEIVRLLGEGRRVASIARDLGLSVHTVRNHLRAIFRKLEVHSQEDLLDVIRGLPPSAFRTLR